jgi:hypothetical protein
MFLSTKQEVLDTLDAMSESRDIEINKTEFNQFGFTCIHNFCFINGKWHPSFEDCCPFCVHVMVRDHGSQEDKIQFNSQQDLGDYYIIPVTKKEQALHKKALLKRNKSSKKKADSLALIRNDMKKQGIPMIGRGKSNLYNDLFSFSHFMREDNRRNMKQFFIYIPGLGDLDKDSVNLYFDKHIQKETLEIDIQKVALDHPIDLSWFHKHYP